MNIEEKTTEQVEATETDPRILALAKFLECEINDISEASYGENTFDGPGQSEYLVLTDSEADTRAQEDIKESLWAFNANFLANYTPQGVDIGIIQLIQSNDKCESNNDAFLSMVGDKFSDLVSDAIAADGRGHFISSYDGKENEEGEYYIYRIN